MKKLLLVFLLAVLALPCMPQTKIDINNQTKNQLLGTRLGAAPFTTLTTTCNSTITWNLNSQLVFNAKITTTGACTFNISNPVAGGTYVLIMTHGAAGSMNLGTGCTWKVSNGGAGDVTQSAGTNAIDVLAFIYDGTNCYANFNTNFN